MFRSKQTPAVSEHTKLRMKQISEFVKLNPSAQCVAGGPNEQSTTTYTLRLHSPTAGPLTLHVSLGPLFPERPPVCQVTSHNSSVRLQHKYLDANGYLSLHPKLQATQWSPHCNLGAIMQELVRELTVAPPVAVGGNMPAFASPAPAANGGPQPAMPAPYPGYQPGPAGQQQQQQHYHMHGQEHNGSSGSFMATSPGVMHQQQQSSQQSAQYNNNAAPRRPSGSSSAASPASASPSPMVLSSANGGARTRPPDVPTSFPQLDGMSIVQLEDVLADPFAVRDLAADMDAITSLENGHLDRVQKIESISQANLAKRAQLESLTMQLASESARLRETQQQHASLLQRQQAAASKYSMATVLRLLDESIAVAENASEQAKTRYEEAGQKSSGAAAGGGGAAAANAAEEQQLLEQYIKHRMAFHEHAAKKERLIETYGNR